MTTQVDKIQLIKQLRQYSIPRNVRLEPDPKNPQTFRVAHETSLSLKEAKDFVELCMRYGVQRHYESLGNPDNPLPLDADGTLNRLLLATLQSQDWGHSTVPGKRVIAIWGTSGDDTRQLWAIRRTEQAADRYIAARAEVNPGVVFTTMTFTLDEDRL